MAVHDRPAAFEGEDGFSYSVEIVADASAGDGRWGAYFLFVKWARVGAQSPEGHLETDYVAFDISEGGALRQAGAHALRDVHALLEKAIAARQGASGPSRRRWWDAMTDDPDPHSGE